MNKIHHYLYGTTEFTKGIGGMFAVQLFYIISGFYMALILNKKYTGPGSYRIFLKNRFLRIFPTYYIVLFVTAISYLIIFFKGRFTEVAYIWYFNMTNFNNVTLLFLIVPQFLLIGIDSLSFFGIQPQTGLIFYTSSLNVDIFAGRYVLVPQAWTLGLELLFYIFAPFIVTGKTFRSVIMKILFLIFISLIARFMIGYFFKLNHDPWTYRFFPFELSLFLFGSFAFMMYDKFKDSIYFKNRICLSVFLIQITLLVGFKFVPNIPTFYNLSYLFLIFSIGLPWVFHFSKSIKVDNFIGELSYSVYLSHYFIKEILISFEKQFIYSYLAIITILLTLLFSIILFYCIEKPIDNLRQKLYCKAYS